MENKISTCYTDLERLSFLKSYLESGLSKSNFCRDKCFSRSALNAWLRRYGISDLSTLEPVIIEYNMPTKEEELQAELDQLRREKAVLEKELQHSKFRVEALDLMIDLAESTYKIPVRKNSAAK